MGSSSRAKVTDVRIDIREATPDDAQLLADLGARTFLDTYGADNTEHDMRAYLASAFGPDIQAREIADSGTVFLVAHAGAKAAGYARLRQGEAPAAIGARRPIEVVRFYVDRPWQGRGVGSLLMGAALDLAAGEGCDIVWLDVWERNPRAIAFYGKWAFAVRGRQGFVLGGDVQDDLLMARNVVTG